MFSRIRIWIRMARLAPLCTLLILPGLGQAQTPVVIPQVQIPQIPQQPPQIDIPQISGPDTVKVPEIALPQAVMAEIVAQPQAVVPAAQQLYMAAAPETAIVPIDSTMVEWRLDAAEQLNCIQSNGFQLAFEGLWTILSYDGSTAGATTNAEDLAREARGCFARYAEDMKNIKEFSEGPAVAQREYNTMVQNLRIDWHGQVASYIPGARSGGGGGGNAYRPASPAAAPAAQPSCHTENDYVTEKVPKRAGFDAQGNPYYEMHWDVVKKTRTVCD